MSKLLSRQRVREVLLSLALLCATAALLLFPQQAMTAAKDGLLLCYNVIGPLSFSPFSSSPPLWWTWG